MSLTHKWESRDLLHRLGVELNDIANINNSQEVQDLLKISMSAFKYYNKYRDNIESDRSLKAVCSMCTGSMAQIDPLHVDKHVFHLSRVFNAATKSKRKLHKCYDCGTNARAVFIRLIQAARNLPAENIGLTPNEQKRISEEYWLNVTTPLEEIEQCLKFMLDMPQDAVFIMSVGVQDFGHVWIIEKRFFNGKPRFHQYQSALRSHLLIDFVEREDYGRNPMKSLNITEFMAKIYVLMQITDRPWTDEEHELFADLFAFLPSYKVTKPRPGFCYTYVVYWAKQIKGPSDFVAASIGTAKRGSTVAQKRLRSSALQKLRTRKLLGW